MFQFAKHLHGIQSNKLVTHHQNEDVAELKSEVIPVADPEKKKCVQVICTLGMVLGDKGVVSKGLETSWLNEAFSNFNVPVNVS